MAEQRDPPRPPSRSSIRGASLCSAAAMMLRRLLVSAPPRPRGAAPPRGDGAVPAAPPPPGPARPRNHAVLGRRGDGAARAGPTCDRGSCGIFKGRRAVGFLPAAAAAGRAQRSPTIQPAVAPRRAAPAASSGHTRAFLSGSGRGAPHPLARPGSAGSRSRARAERRGKRTGGAVSVLHCSSHFPLPFIHLPAR